MGPPPNRAEDAPCVALSTANPGGTAGAGGCPRANQGTTAKSTATSTNSRIIQTRQTREASAGEPSLRPAKQGPFPKSPDESGPVHAGALQGPSGPSGRLRG